MIRLPQRAFRWVRVSYDPSVARQIPLDQSGHIIDWALVSGYLTECGMLFVHRPTYNGTQLETGGWDISHLSTGLKIRGMPDATLSAAWQLACRLSRSRVQWGTTSVRELRRSMESNRAVMRALGY